MPLSSQFQAAIPAIQAVKDANPSIGKRALVVIYLGGGADNHNTLIPRAGSSNRVHYDAARPTTAIPDNPATALDANWQLHPRLTKLKGLWDEGKLAVVTNVGPLVQPTSKQQAIARSVPLPVQLYSHSDQNLQWQTGRAGPNYTMTSGWVGRGFDLVHSVYNGTGVLNKLQFGYAPTLAMDASEATQFTLAAGSGPTTRSLAGATAGVSSNFDAINTAIANLFPKPSIVDYSNRVIQGNQNAVTLKTAHDTTTNPTGFPTSSIALQLQTACRMIAAQDTGTNQNRTAIFTTRGGFDQHAELIEVLDGNYLELNDALIAYDNALTTLGIRNRVVTLIYTEFGRSLTQNGTGTDHAWGGNAFVFGQDVVGGFYGQIPNLDLNGSNMIDTRGYLVPTTSFETLYATILRWYGIPDATANGVNPMKLVLPNIDSFTVRNLNFLPAMQGT